MKIRSRGQCSLTPDQIIDEIVQTILSTWSAEDLEYVQRGKDQFGLVGRQVRNEFNLWSTTHELTKNWHSFPDDRDIRDGVDYSPDHPDQVSALILQKVRERL